jgi:DNA-binding NarL/FixJ family response regulator
MDTGTKFSSPLDALTKRQREIVQLTANGLTTKQTARVLNIMPKTVEVHKGRIMKRLEVDRMITVVKVCVSAGLVK